MMRRRLDLLVASVVVVTVASCSATDDSRVGTSMEATLPVATSTPPPPTTVTSTTTPAASTTNTAPTTTVGPEESALALCSNDTTVGLGQVANPTLDEVSGLAVSRRHPGVIWAHNDGNERPGLFALGDDGADLGFHQLTVGGVVDVEDMAIISGPDGDDILLGDIGDNGASRPSIRVYRFAEPDPAVIALIADVDVLEYTYPDRAHNAEVLLVDEIERRVVIVTKEQQRVDGRPAELGSTAASFVFEGPLDVTGDEPVELTRVGLLDAALLETRTVADPRHPTSLLGLGGLPTGGDVAPDGALIALRTYETTWVWPRLAGTSVAESLASDPCQARVAAENQGEAVAFRNSRLITLSEGVNPWLYELRR